VLYLEGPEEVMVKRLTGRGRSDDNEETIKKRLRVNQRDAEPVVAYFDKVKKLVRVNCNDTPEGRSFKNRAKKQVSTPKSSSKSKPLSKDGRGS
jgi:adenylate kinase family enzyme